MPLYPIRIDTSSPDQQFRIVDTLLIDPSLGQGDHKRSSDWALIHAERFAESVVSDAAVTGMGRANRHFTGRIDVAVVEMIRRVVEQIQPQLERAHQLYCQNAKTKVQTSKGSQSLIPIRLRMSIHGVRIHDDFEWDPNDDNYLEFAESMVKDMKLSADSIQAIAVDLCEQVHAAAAAAANTASTSETQHQHIVPDQATPDTLEDDEAGPLQRTHTTAAWQLPQRVHVTNVAHLVAQHRPPVVPANAADNNVGSTTTT